MSVTVVIACLNAEQTIGAMLDSLAGQGDALHEAIVVDGGSSDATLEIVKSATDRLGERLRWTSGPDAGIYDALNKGVALSTGDHVLVLGADDTLMPGALGAIVEASTAHPHTDLLYGDAVIRWPDGGTEKQMAAQAPRMLGGVPRGLPVCHQACAFSRSAFQALGPFDPLFRIAGDYEFYLRFHEAGLAARHVPQTIAVYSMGGLSSRQAHQTAREYRRARVLHGVNPLLAGAAMYVSMVRIAAGSVLRGGGSNR